MINWTSYIWYNLHPRNRIVASYSFVPSASLMFVAGMPSSSIQTTSPFESDAKNREISLLFHVWYTFTIWNTYLILDLSPSIITPSTYSTHYNIIIHARFYDLFHKQNSRGDSLHSLMKKNVNTITNYYSASISRALALH